MPTRRRSWPCCHQRGDRACEIVRRDIVKQIYKWGFGRRICGAWRAGQERWSCQQERFEVRQDASRRTGWGRCLCAFRGRIAERRRNIFSACARYFRPLDLSKGRLLPNEPHQDGVKRKVKEEIGLDVEVEEQLGENEYIANDSTKGGTGKKKDTRHTFSHALLLTILCRRKGRARRRAVVSISVGRRFQFL